MIFKTSFFGAILVLSGVSASAQYPAPGAPMTASPSAPAMVPAAPGVAAPSRPAITSATPNTVNAGFPQGGTVPGIPGASGRPMPTLNPYQGMQQSPVRSFNGPAQYGQHTPSAAPEKPFANYEAAPMISPYMNLYRRDNYTGIDNYNMYVKPALEAEQKRQQMQMQLNSMQEAQTQQQIQQQAQFNTNVGASTVGASYGQMNTGMNANRPGASYGFSGSGPTVHVDPASLEKTDKEKADEKAEKEDEKDDEKDAAYFNPYVPKRRGHVNPHYEPAR